MFPFYFRAAFAFLESEIGSSEITACCFRFEVKEEHVIEQLRAAAWPIVEGPVMRTGATQKIRSVYVRDPDFNLIEISELV